jgi:uncharacterized protein
MKDYALIDSDACSLEDKVAFLGSGDAYSRTPRVTMQERDNDFCFFTDQYVYKLKKPVVREYLNYSSIEFRHSACIAEVALNNPLAHGVYTDVLPLTHNEEGFGIDGRGHVVDWVLRRRRLPPEKSLRSQAVNHSIDPDNLLKAASKLADFYISSKPVSIDPHGHRQRILKSIERASTLLLRRSARVPHNLVVSATTDLLHYLIGHIPVFDFRVDAGCVVDAHGALSPDNIFLLSEPLIIERVECDPSLRLLDIVDELSSIAMECEVLGIPNTGNTFLSVYANRSGDEFTEDMVSFFKGRRAFMQASAMIPSQSGKKGTEDLEWKMRCLEYLGVAESYCRQLPLK